MQALRACYSVQSGALAQLATQATVSKVTGACCHQFQTACAHISITCTPAQRMNATCRKRRHAEVKGAGANTLSAKTTHCKAVEPTGSKAPPDAKH